uniref:Uncharacterized protein n=1 Tax=Arundo donax TaxID=35708 RepID=A0A0A9F0P4_ARUDO
MLHSGIFLAARQKNKQYSLILTERVI